MRVRHAAEAVALLFEEAKSRNLIENTDWSARIDHILQNVWHSQISDFSGVNPWRGEIIHGLRMNRWLRNEN